MSIRLSNDPLVTDEAPSQVVTVWAGHKVQRSHRGGLSRAGSGRDAETEGEHYAGRGSAQV